VWSRTVLSFDVAALSCSALVVVAVAMAAAAALAMVVVVGVVVAVVVVVIVVMVVVVEEEDEEEEVVDALPKLGSGKSAPRARPNATPFLWKSKALAFRVVSRTQQQHTLLHKGCCIVCW
jgi:hypothetical protein